MKAIASFLKRAESPKVPKKENPGLGSSAGVVFDNSAEFGFTESEEGPTEIRERVSIARIQ